MINYYELLGVDNKATKKEIKDAYKKISLKIHPDVIGDSSTSDIFRTLTEAKDTLLDESSRMKYDHEIENATTGNTSSNQQYPSSQESVISSDPSDSIVSLSYVLHAEKLIELIKKEHNNYNNGVVMSGNYGTLEVDAIDLVCGVNNKKIDTGNGEFIVVNIEKNSSPGDFGTVTSNGMTDKAILLLNDATTKRSLYYKKKAHLLFTTDPEMLSQGGMMDVSDIEEAKRAGISTINIPAGSPPIYEKTTQYINFILIDERILNRIHNHEYE